MGSYQKKNAKPTVNMEREKIKEIVNTFFIEDMEVEEDKLKANALLKEDLGLDSLDFVDIVVVIERNFGFKIKPEEMTDVNTLSKFYDYIESKVGNK